MCVFKTFLQLIIVTNCGLVVPQTTDCGQPVIAPLLDNSTFWIFGGKEARPHSWPWKVYIKTCPSQSACDFCGGSLVSRDKVITAAHCTNFGALAPSQFKIRIGMHNIRNPVGSENGDVQMGIKSYETKSRDPSSVNDDLAILTLEVPVNYSDTVSPICIPATDPPAGTVCYSTGWGNTESGSSDVLRQVTLPITTEEACKKELNGVPYESKLCAGAQSGKDTCEGDSGGPLVCQMENKWNLVGITSYGNAACGTTGRPGVYSRVTYFREWIVKNL